jgi:BirA family transcriptional regulator, biotin operon repressor / biotin---[acetyl-CoA-carboxylase] ligase
VLGTDLACAYRAACRTLGRRVRLELPDGGEVVGIAVDIAADGSLVVDTDDGPRTSYAAADVVHLRTRG